MVRLISAASFFVSAACATESPLNVKLNNGVEMPLLAFAAQVWPVDTCNNATAEALKAGFRFVWSSALIGSDCQTAQGQAIAASAINRTELFVSGTVNSAGCQDKASCYQQTISDANAQFDILGLKQLDMLMLDYPASEDCGAISGQWQAFEELYAASRVRTIAVSNFDETQLQCITSNASATVPSVNMLQYAVGQGTSTIIADNGKYGIVVQAYSPLDGGVLVDDALCTSIGQVHNKSAVQVALKWILQRNATVATQSTKASHLRDDMDIFDFILSDDEMGQLNQHSATMLV